MQTLQAEAKTPLHDGRQTVSTGKHFRNAIIYLVEIVVTICSHEEVADRIFSSHYMKEEVISIKHSIHQVQPEKLLIILYEC